MSGGYENECLVGEETGVQFTKWQTAGTIN